MEIMSGRRGMGRPKFVTGSGLLGKVARNLGSEETEGNNPARPTISAPILPVEEAEKIPDISMPVKPEAGIINEEAIEDEFGNIPDISMPVPRKPINQDQSY